MFGLIGRLFGSDNSINKSIDLVATGLDKIFYTKEEKAEDERQARAEGAKQFLKWMEATSGQNLTRRFIALTILFSWIAWYTSGVVLRITAIWVKDPVVHAKMAEASQIAIDMGMNFNTEISLIIGFYFAAPYMDKMISPVMKNLSRRADKNDK